MAPGPEPRHPSRFAAAGGGISSVCMSARRPFVIAHLSDLHCGSPYFVGNLLQRAIMEINRIQPDVVVCSGDLTTFGYKQEYRQAAEYLARLDCPDVITIPGNHDSRNVGYVHFDQMI